MSLLALLIALSLTGQATIVDGDTLRLGEERVRLFGIDAPELAQTCGDVRCGEIARDWLNGFVADRTVACEGAERDQYGRLVARCSVAGVDIGRAAVGAGMAIAYVEYSRDYLADEQAAKAAGTGLWAVGLTSPAEYRQAQRSPSTASADTTAPDQSCSVKGNINSRGDRIYHLPSSSSYSATVIDTSKGERWFCSAADAEAAGWRAPRG